jgi:hypothetical protein
MLKIENLMHDLLPLFESYFKTSDAQNLKNYLVAQSNLPGPRANLELVKAFAELVEDFSKHNSEKLWLLNLEFIKISATAAPTNDPGEFVPFCGANGIGAIGAADFQYFELALSILKMLANDPRWRLREAVCFGLQRLLAKRNLDTLNRLEGWIIDGTLLELRAVAVAVAEPVLLKNMQIANRALDFHQQILKRIQSIANRKLENFRILRQALGFTLSVVICGIPEAGFELLQNLVTSNDPDLLWIVKENLNKHRLIKNFPDEVEHLKKII